MDPLIYARHGADAHAGHSSVTGTDGSMSTDTHMSMMAVFQTSMATSLFSTKWTPTTTGAYAGTCIFLIVFAAIFRGLLALKSWQELRWLDKEMNRRYVVVNGKAPLAENLSRDSLGKSAVLSENGVEENVVVVQRRTGGHARPWRLSVDPVRAVIDTVVAGVGYLLMLAVMSMNVGYFLSVLGGTFLGSLLVGRYSSATEH
ncbi:Ctr copper transporter family-domain-containing protein [Triangularia verruculosa]|uniref:Copper transport protein n=1 Tax=Triangularia verruculosa TaxID=2587418 RepID=A0AAN6XH16_9PEZI|nr:Ctr copper transporter family-domain-containing protein [Triangularia verruculosa]